MTTGKFYPPGQLKPLSPGQAKNGFTNFWNSKSAAAASAAFIEVSIGNAFCLSADNSGWVWMDMTSPPTDWNTIMCMGVGEVITSCKNLDDCKATDPGQSECVCPDGSSADPDPDNDPSTQDLATCPAYDACSEIGQCIGSCENEYKSPFYRCSCPALFNGMRYHLAYDGRTCVDINECEINTHLCDETTECKNVEGSYSSSYECICKKTGLAVTDKTGEFYSCLECPCTSCLNADWRSGFCATYDDCAVPIDLKTDLTDLVCPDGFKCEDYKNLKCPIGEENSCLHVSECAFDCEGLGTGWFCPLEACLEKENCEFSCIDDSKCPEDILSNRQCSDQNREKLSKKITNDQSDRLMMNDKEIKEDNEDKKHNTFLIKISQLEALASNKEGYVTYPCIPVS
ncbi:unnamed protein product [Oikopleura dioica]|uniref:Uncharacterized protein n=1 Tax=Oikopleura dioica TaxID=34765 RepID=E4XR10_OIKDI|nr:unnamed protein product [Oikopleura dioica]